MRIAVDIDNTIADYTGALREYVRERYPGLDDYPMTGPKDYGFTDPAWPFGAVEEFRAMHAKAVAAGLYLKEEVLPYVEETIDLLEDRGHQVMFCTSRRDDTHGDTLRWLNAHHLLPADRGLWMGGKLLLDADLYIEDSPYAIRTLADAGKTVLHPDRPYLDDSMPGLTFKDWRDVPDIIASL